MKVCDARNVQMTIKVAKSGTQHDSEYAGAFPQRLFGGFTGAIDSIVQYLWMEFRMLELQIYEHWWPAQDRSFV